MDSVRQCRSYLALSAGWWGGRFATVYKARLHSQLVAVKVLRELGGEDVVLRRQVLCAEAVMMVSVLFLTDRRC